MKKLVAFADLRWDEEKKSVILFVEHLNGQTEDFLEVKLQEKPSFIDKDSFEWTNEEWDESDKWWELLREEADKHGFGFGAYKVVETRQSYDPEGLNIPSPECVPVVGSLEDCVMWVVDTYREKKAEYCGHKDVSVEMKFDLQKMPYVEIYFLNAISKRIIRIEKEAE